MSYGKHFYLLPGDTVKSKQENFNFHRDMTYKISKCFQLNGNLIIYVENKWGKDARYIPQNFEDTAKTAAACERRRECTLINFWQHSGDSYELWLGWDNSVELLDPDTDEYEEVPEEIKKMILSFDKHFPISNNLFLISW